MLQAGSQSNFSLESLGPKGDRQVRTQDLQSYEAVVSQVMRQVHRSHAAAAELALDAVGGPNSRLQMLEGIRHQSLKQGESM